MSSRHLHKTTKLYIPPPIRAAKFRRSLPCNLQRQQEILSRVSPSIGEFSLVVNLQLFKRKPVEPAKTLCTQSNNKLRSSSIVVSLRSFPAILLIPLVSSPTTHSKVTPLTPHNLNTLVDFLDSCACPQRRQNWSLLG